MNITYISILNIYQRYRMLIAQIEDLNEDCIKISNSIFYTFPRNKPSKSVTVWSGRFIILNDSAGPKMVIHLYLTFFRFFLKVLEPI